MLVEVIIGAVNHIIAHHTVDEQLTDIINRGRGDEDTNLLDCTVWCTSLFTTFLQWLPLC